MMFKNAFLLLLLISVWVIAGLYSKNDSSPRYSVNQLVKAIEQHSIITVRKYADIDQVISGIVGDLLDKTAEDYKPKSDLEAVGKIIGLGMLDTLKPKIIAYGKESIINLIEKGIFEHKTTQKSAQTISLTETWNRTEKMFKDYRGIEYVKEEGGRAVVGLKLYHHNYDENFTLDLEMIKMDGYWRAIKLLNFLELHDRITELEKGEAQASKPTTTSSH